MTAVTQMKCACSDCLCIVNLNEAVMKDGKAYCGEACANGHAEGTGCGYTGCGCHS